ncbi:hypothetical protein [Micromonospora noduli]|uniref:Calcium-binding protein n=1 Tax=Micromonospora noduli TaxID=709876 RepID=A0A328N719_9ACTN|nr:hypothetical protein [Micromonospora noduli]KAB1927450.1 hypothetical protein F8280_06510 [Micromonospora noduli]RAN98919.1 Calcium-binding protein [Micromonospora noduli]RAO10029.1 Calcium-binding protein [Micromonospora noduli]RAO46396.1 Calcium-binding protein [Micromonospora noduli]
MSQPPANPYGPPHDSPDPSQQPGQQPGGWPPPQQQGQPQQPGGFPPAQSGFPPAQPGFPPAQPGFPAAQPGQPYGDPNLAGGPPPAKKSNVGKIVLIVLAAVLVLCLGGVAITWFVVKDDVGAVVDASKTRVVAPATLAGRPKLTNPELLTAAEQAVSGMKTAAGNETSTVAAFYGDPTKQDLVMIAAVSGLLSDPKKELDAYVDGLSKQLTVGEMTAVDAGPLGGEARCGDGKADTVPLGICVWTDRGSLGMVVMYFKSADQAKAEFTAIRGQVEQQS